MIHAVSKIWMGAFMNGFISANVLQHPFVELNCEDDGVGKAAIRNQR